MAQPDWLVEIDKLEKGREAFNAALLTISNGYVGTRGTNEETNAGAPRTFIAGLFNPEPLGMETMVSVQNWLATRLFVEGSQFFYEVGELLKYSKILDMKRACVTKRIETENREGRITRIESVRFVSMDDPHLLGLRYKITPVNYSGNIRILSGLDGRIATSGYDHFDEIEKGSEHNVIFNIVKANRSDNVVAMAAAFDVSFDYNANVIEEEKRTWLELSFCAEKNKTYTVDKLVSVYTSRESENPREDAIRSAGTNADTGFDKLFEKHVAAWDALWKKHDVVIDGDPAAQHAIRFCIYQLLSVGPHHADDTNIGAKALTGDRYRGHVFWDTEIYLQPFYNLTEPELAGKLLMYRHNRLGPAREKAKSMGARGACFVWESADSGREMVPGQWIFPETGQIEILYLGDQEIHTSLAVSYAVWHYYISTGHKEFLHDYGLELMLESALFYATRAELDKETGEYEIRNVTGPDEHHSNANNSVYINTLAKWNIETILRYLDELEKSDPELAAKLRDKAQVTDEDIALMKAVAEKIKINSDPETKLIEEFDDFFKLKNLYRDTPNIVPGEKPGAQIVKQADVVLLMCLFPDMYDAETKRTNYEYYEPHTDHLSSLSAGAHAVMAADIGKLDEAYDFFMESSMIDLKSEKPDCVDGIHIASCGGAWQAVVFGFAGLTLTENGLSIDPHLPEKWKSLSFNIVYNNNEMKFAITRSEIRIETTVETKINICGEQLNLAKGINVFPHK